MDSPPDGQLDPPRSPALLSSSSSPPTIPTIPSSSSSSLLQRSSRRSTTSHHSHRRHSHRRHHHHDDDDDDDEEEDEDEEAEDDRDDEGGHEEDVEPVSSPPPLPLTMPPTTAVIAAAASATALTPVVALPSSSSLLLSSLSSSSPILLSTPTDLLVHALDDELTCPICYDVFRQPIMTACGHAFCARCIERWAKTHRNCPTCRKYLPPEGFAPDERREAHIRALPVSCRSCAWSGCFAELSDHLMEGCPAVASKVNVVRNGVFFENVLREALRRFRQKKFVKIHCHTCRSALRPGDYMFVHQTRCRKHSSHLKMHLECMICAQSLFLQSLHETLQKPQLFVALDPASSGLAVPAVTIESRNVVLLAVRQEKGLIHCNGCNEVIPLKSDCHVCLHESHRGSDASSSSSSRMFYCQKCFTSAKYCTFHPISVVAGSLKISHGLGLVEGPLFEKSNREVKNEKRRWFRYQGPLLSCNACGACVDTEDFYRCLDCGKSSKVNYNLCQNCYISYRHHTEHLFVKILDDLTRPSPFSQKMRALSYRLSTMTTSSSSSSSNPSKLQASQQQQRLSGASTTSNSSDGSSSSNHFGGNSGASTSSDHQSESRKDDTEPAPSSSFSSSSKDTVVASNYVGIEPSDSFSSASQHSIGEAGNSSNAASSPREPSEEFDNNEGNGSSAPPLKDRMSRFLNEVSANRLGSIFSHVAPLQPTSTSSSSSSSSSSTSRRAARTYEESATETASTNPTTGAPDEGANSS